MNGPNVPRNPNTNEKFIVLRVASKLTLKESVFVDPIKSFIGVIPCDRCGEIIDEIPDGQAITDHEMLQSDR
jgi:hypothetical protein